jgi:hypothetical protein
MKTKLVALAFLVGMSGTALAQGKPTTWQGAMTITKFAGACDDLDGLRVGQLGTAIFRPRIGTSGPSRVQFLWSKAAANYQKNGNGQMNGAGNYTATKLGSRAGSEDFQGAFHLVQSPANVTAATPSVTLTGTLTNFHNKACTATISAVFSKRPNTDD